MSQSLVSVRKTRAWVARQVAIRSKMSTKQYDAFSARDVSSLRKNQKNIFNGVISYLVFFSIISVTNGPKQKMYEVLISCAENVNLTCRFRVSLCRKWQPTLRLMKD